MTDDIKELVERLRRSIHAYEVTGNGGMRHCEDMRQAADTIEALQDRVERLEEAIQIVLDDCGHTIDQLGAEAQAKLAALQAELEAT